MVSSSGPVRVYAFPSWPGEVSAFTATAAMSRGSIGAPFPSPVGEYTTPCALMVGIQPSALEANAPGRRTVHASPEAWSFSSLARCQRPIAMLGSISAAITESRTTCATPAAFAASMALPSSLDSSGPVETRKALLTPANAGPRVSGASRSPCTTATAPPSLAAAFAGSRASARTGAPASSNCFTTSPPMLPVAPVTRIMVQFPFREIVAGNFTSCAPLVGVVSCADLFRAELCAAAPSEVDMNNHALPAHVLQVLVRLHTEGRRATLEMLVEALRVRRGDVRRTLSALHREGFVDVLRMRPTLAGFALGRALEGVELPALRVAKVAAVVAA